MPISNARGEQYPFVDATHNIVKGACWRRNFGYGCKYCFTGLKQLGRGQYDGPLVVHEEEFQQKYKPGKFYFIGSACDHFHPKVSDYDIGRILSNCTLWQRQTPGSLQAPRFLFQSKGPERFSRFIGEFPPASTLATTYETDDLELYGDMTSAPSPHDRFQAMKQMYEQSGGIYPMMLTIEPIMKFKDVEHFVDQVASLPWAMIAIGADSCDAIPREKQPDASFVSNLAERLSECESVRTVVIKSNCANLVDGRDAQTFMDYWDVSGWIYHRKSAKEKKAEQGVLF
jgi:hypothetical protein